MNKYKVIITILILATLISVLSGCSFLKDSSENSNPVVTEVPGKYFDVTVQVKDLKTGLGIPLAKVNLVGPSSRSENTNQQGLAYFTKVKEGTYNISVTAQNYYSLSSQTYIGSTTVLTYEMEKAPIVIDNPGQGSLTVRVYDLSKNPIPFATVKIVHLSTGMTFNGQTDTNGRCQFDKLQLGRYRLTVYKNGYEQYVTDNIWLEDGDFKIVEVTLYQL
jgi:hypothetical protein